MMKLIYRLFLGFLLLVIAACEKTGEEIKNSMQEYIFESKESCQLAKAEYRLKDGRLVRLPAIGKVVQESHYVTTQDEWPQEVTQGIEKHLDISCNLLALYGVHESFCPQIYKTYWARQFGPSEGGGHIGQNARGKKMYVVDELFWGTMYFSGKSNMPKPGERWLIRNPINRKSVVIAMGYEIGPSSSDLLAGSSVEVFFLLDAENHSKLELGPLADQTLPLGPIDCQ